MKPKNYLIPLFFLFAIVLLPLQMSAQTLIETYTEGDIPTSLANFNDTCNGPGTTIGIQLPVGGPWEVTGIDIEYDMTAAATGTMAEQRSYIYFQNDGVGEETQSGSGAGNGTFNYDRQNVTIANGFYQGDEELIFQMRAWRTTSFQFPLCNPNLNKVDDNTWSITVHYQSAPSCIPPQSLTASSTSSAQGIVSWTEIGVADQWNIEYGPEGFTQGSGMVVSGIDSESHQITGLDPLSTYDVYVQSDCGGEESSWVGPVSFTTSLTIAVEVTGFNEDVIANGIGTMNSSTTNIVDNDSFCFLSLDWKLNAGSPNAPVGLPVNGVISNNGIVYQMSPFNTPYEGNNSLRINSNTSETLTLNEPNNFEELYFLTTSGSGSSNVTIEVNFDDATSQIFSGITIPDWYQTGLPVEASGFGRGNVNNNNVETPAGNPKLFRITTALLPANQGKSVTSVTFTRNSGNVVNIFAVSGIDADACLAPTSLALIDVIDTVAEVSWEISYTESDGYSWALMAAGENPINDSPIDNGSLSTGETNLTISDLTPQTQYDFYIKADCGLDGESSWEGPLSFETLATCPEPANIQLDDVAETTAAISWEASFNESDGYLWALMASGDDPDSGTPVENGTTPTGQTDVILSDLTPGFQYDFYIKTDCGAEGESSWTDPLTFSTLALSSAGTYTSGDIPTNFGSFDATCNGPLTTLTVDLPAGGPWEVTGFDVSYNMVAASGAWRSEQRSLIHFQNLDISEPGAPFNGTGNSAGTQDYNRNDINIANGYYAGEDALIFEMRAWRTWQGGGTCNTTYNRVANNSWNITVYYQLAPSCIPPQDLVISGITANETDVSWTEIGDAEAWSLEYGQSGFVLGDGTLVTDIDSETYQITGLDPETEYDVYVWSDCGGGDESDWQMISFETLPSCPIPTNVILNEVTATTAEFSWEVSPNETEGYIWMLMEPGDDPDTDTPIDTGTTTTGATTLEIIGLAPDAGYDFYLRADCGTSNGLSQWTSVINFTTSILSFPIELIGLNADVIANGIGTMASSTNNDVDGVNFIFISEDWKLTEGSPNAPVGLPENGIVSSSLEGVFYNMSPFETPYEGNNVLRIESNGTSSDLEFLTPAPYEALYFLVTSGSGSSNINIEVNFIDNTSQNFNSIAISDWFNGTPFEAAGFGRGSLNDNNLETPFNNPRLYRVTTQIDLENQAKTISSVTVTKNSGGVLNVFAITGKSGNPCIAPSGITFDVLSDTQIDVSWTPAPLETGGYEWALMEEGEHPGTGTPVDMGTTATGVNNVSIDNLVADTAYDFYIMTICADGSSFWGGPHATQTLPTCAPPSNLAIVDIDESTIEASWAASPHATSGYNWAVMLPGENPDTDTPLQEGLETGTSVEVSGLETNTEMVFFVRTDCDPNGSSSWLELSFIIESVGSICENAIEVTSLPYSHTDNTAEYLNIYSGAPGVDCGTSDGYLNGFDVVYHLIAPEDDLITIELADITGTYAGVFVYESCGDIMNNCIAGVVAGNTEDDIAIVDFAVTQGNSYYIVVSSWQSLSIDYTLNIYGFDCLTFEAPEGEEEQSFVGGDVITDLEVEATMNDVSFTWYEDEDLTIEIIDPATELLVNGETYYVTQTLNINGCESSALAILALEIDCTMLSIVDSTGDMLCTPGGVMTLTATASGNGDAIYWYDALSDGNLVGIGEELTVDVNVTTSFWASEVYLEDGIGDSGPLPSYCTSFGFGTGCTGGDRIDDFILSDSNGNDLISHLNSGCSPNAYGDFTNDPNLTATLMAGETYNFTATHNFNNQRIKIWIDIDKDGEFDDATELLFSSPSGANPTNGSFTIPQEAIGNTTVMRVFDRYNALPVDACTSGGSWGEVHDYKVTVVGASMLCGSDPVEVVAIVNTEFPVEPIVDEEQFVCTGTTLNDIEVIGEDIIWYSAAFVELVGDTQVQNGATYYVTQTVGLCESDYAEVLVTIMNPADTPTGSQNQTFVDGETIADLEVDGENLVWYADEDATVELPTSTILVDQETYYVTQTTEGFCESQTFGITVYQILTIDEIFFGELTYYPNPVKGKLNIENSFSIDSVEVYNAIGQRLIAENANSDTVVLDMEDLKSGVYFVNIKIDDRTMILKIVKE